MVIYLINGYSKTIDDYKEFSEDDSNVYVYGSKPHAVTSITSGGQTIRQYSYDPNGNMTQRIEGSDTYTFAYDAENRLVSGAKNGVTLASYTYDGDGKRVKAVEGVNTTYYIGDYYEWREGSTTTAVKYYYAAGQRIAMRQGSTLTWLLGDHLGSATITATENGTLASEQKYTAWGQTRSGSVGTDRQYTGQISEPQLGIYFYNARYYDPYLNRFLSPDTIIFDPYNPVDWDRYAYVRNDPINGSDPSGHMRTESDGCFFAECGYTGPDYFPGGSTKQEKALKLLNHLIEDQLEGGPQYSWAGLHEQHRKIFDEAGWNEAIYNDSVQPAISKADAAHDPAFYIVTAFTLGKLGPKVITALASYFCLDGDCGNEFEITFHARLRMAQRGVSIDQLQEALQQNPFRYFHEGVWKLGYYDVVNRIFVGVEEANRIITTIITNVKPGYIENLKKVVGP